MDRLERELVAAERAACAELVRAFDSDDLARMFHEAYEDLAPRFGYETRPESRKTWNEVPDKNRCLMRATVSRVAHALAAAIEARTVAMEPLRRPDRLDPEPSEPPLEEFP